MKKYRLRDGVNFLIFNIIVFVRNGGKDDSVRLLCDSLSPQGDCIVQLIILFATRIFLICGYFDIMQIFSRLNEINVRVKRSDIMKLNLISTKNNY